MVSALVASVVAPVLRRATERSPNVLTRVVGQVVPSVVDSVDVDALLHRVDVDALLDRVDVDALLDRIDVDRLMARVDVTALLERIDVQELVGRVDIDALLAQVDLNALLDRVDVAALAKRAEIGDLVAKSTSDVAGSTLDLVRRQLVALDVILMRLVQKGLRRRGTELHAGPPALVGDTTSTGPDRPRTEPRLGRVTGRYAGPVTRLAEFAIDASAVIASFGLIANVFVFSVRVVLGVDVETSNTQNRWWLAGYVLWALLYYWVSLAISGRTIGKWLVGVRVVQRDGAPLRTGAAFVRVVALPLSLASLGIGLVGVVVGKERRALHDVLAGSVVVYDWGDRPAEMSAPLTRWLDRQGALEPPAPGPRPG
jgi:uncharacterized RDD family membrane protein YckC